GDWMKARRKCQAANGQRRGRHASRSALGGFAFARNVPVIWRFPDHAKPPTGRLDVRRNAAESGGKPRFSVTGAVSRTGNVWPVGSMPSCPAAADLAGRASYIVAQAT